MKTFLHMLLLGSITLTSCSDLNGLNRYSSRHPDSPGRPSDTVENGENTHKTDSTETDLPQVPTIPSHLYYTIVNTPENYDFVGEYDAMRDDCEILLYRDSTLLLSIPAGPSTETGLGSESHFLIDKHLYTSWSSGKGSVLKRDGEALFRFDDYRALKSLYVDGADIWSLWILPQKSMFSLCHGNSVVLENDFSRAPSDLYEDDGHVCFSYGISVFGETSCIIVQDGKERALNFPDGADIMCIMSSHGKIIAAGNTSDGAACIIRDGSVEPLPTTWLMICAEFSGSSDNLVLSGSMTNRYGTEQRDFVYANGVLYQQLDMLDRRVFYDGEHLDMIFIQGDGSVLIEHDGKKSYPDSNLLQFSLGCACQNDGDFAVALMDRANGYSPLIWYNDNYIRPETRGYITCLSLAK